MTKIYRCKDAKGYLRIYKMPKNKGDKVTYDYEHRLIMSNHLGRSLNKDEDVHHLDGNKQNNKIENLVLINHRIHSRNTRIKRIDNPYSKIVHRHHRRTDKDIGTIEHNVISNNGNVYSSMHRLRL